MTELTDERLAARFHEAYERLAPDFGYATREASAKPWAEVPENNRALMTAVVREIRASLTAELTNARRHHAEVQALLEAYEESSNTIAGYIPEHYEGSEGAQIAIVEEWASHAADVVAKAHHWRKVPNEQTAAALDAAVEVIYPTGEYL